MRVPTEEFVRYVAARLPEHTPPESLRALHTSELYLACACLRGDARAIKALEATHFSMIEGAVARLGASQTAIDDIKQVVREEVLVGFNGRQPALTGYSGRGALGGWLRVTAVRTALRVLKKQVGETAAPELPNHLPDPRDDPELENLKAHYQSAFQEALEAAILALSDQQRCVLRYRYVDGLTLDDIALVYHAHRATIARWLAKARREIFDRTRRLLTAELHVDASDYESVLRLIRSHVNINLSELLPNRSRYPRANRSASRIASSNDPASALPVPAMS